MPAWAARLELGTISAALNTVSLSLVAKASKRSSIHANLLDASDAYRWLAFWQPLNLTARWAPNAPPHLSMPA